MKRTVSPGAYNQLVMLAEQSAELSAQMDVVYDKARAILDDREGSFTNGLIENIATGKTAAQHVDAELKREGIAIGWKQ